MQLEVTRVLAEGLGRPEGPVALADGSVLVVEMERGRLSRVDQDGDVSTAADLGGCPNGAAIGPDGWVYICNSGQPVEDVKFVPPSIQKVNLATGETRSLYESCEGKPFRAPNDLVFDATGNFWFTDYAYGKIYYASPDGAFIRQALSRLSTPNGVGLSQDQSTLYWAQTRTRQVFRRRILEPGVLADGVGYDIETLMRFGEADRWGLVAGLPGAQELDSLAVDSENNVCVGTLMTGGITVFWPGDGSTTFCELPSTLADPVVTNICFGGSDLMFAYITLTLTGRLVECRWPVAGLPLAFGELASCP